MLTHVAARWLLLVGTIVAGCRADPLPISRDRAPSASPGELCLLAANDCTAAIISSDQGASFEPDKVLGCIAPAAITRAGGRDKVIATRAEQRRNHRALNTQLSADDRRFGTMHVENERPSLIDGGPITFAVVPSIITLDMPLDTRIRGRTFMLSVSEDGGKSWRFVSTLVSGSHALTRATIETMFPTFPKSASLPPPRADEALLGAGGEVLAVPDPKTGKWPWS